MSSLYDIKEQLDNAEMYADGQAENARDLATCMEEVSYAFSEAKEKIDEALRQLDEAENYASDIDIDFDYL